MMARLLDSLAMWLTEELAAGTSAKWLVFQAAASVEYIADLARGATDDDWDTSDWTRPDVRPVRPYIPPTRDRPYM